MHEGNKQAMLFCKKRRLLKLIKEVEDIINELDVTYEEVRGWVEN